MFDFLKKYSFIIKIYVIIILILNLIMVGMYFRFKRDLTTYKKILNNVKGSNKSKETLTNKKNTNNKDLGNNNVNITIEEV